MVEREFDILVIGATGYTGRLVIEYLANHSRASSLHIALGGRTISKVQDLANKYHNIGAVYVDVDKEQTVQEAVAKTRVVINIAGPYWTRGSVVVRACARNGVHYVDLTGEAPRVSKIIEDFFEDVPREHRLKGAGWGLSPMPAPPGYRSKPSILYSLPYVKPTIWGGIFFMNGINAPIVRRSWGLRHYQLYSSHLPTFSYTEFHNTGSRLNGVLLSLGLMTTMFGLAVAPPLRWLLKWVMPKSGEGPKPDKLDSGRFEVINVAEGGGIVVKARMDGDGDPGYRITSIMIVESALLLLDPENLTEDGKEGGVLTPSVAYGDALVKALDGTGRFRFGVEVLEDKKTR
ncbi:unnamed protein product [Rhizoctonia solani]|uniref:Saccharopine dehydrogenase NADP binding domain-containing protein n=1 Tax=Rhizoctonia solani TaxID=456999 RepID=A0A8H2ZU71_9AGAM|nr:unnamed protein product [Rhizoctonia solani]